MNTSSQVWVEIVGDIIIARIRGIPTLESLTDCQQRIVSLQADTQCSRVLYDSLELERPPIDIVLTQQAFSTDLGHSALKVAIVVPNTAIAYLSRLAFGDLNHRVFYNDMAAALKWLADAPLKEADSKVTKDTK